MSFTGFPSRIGHFGIRRLSVSFGLGPRGHEVAVAHGVPATRGSVPTLRAELFEERLRADVTAPLPEVVLTPHGFVAVGELASYLAEVETPTPTAGCDAPQDSERPRERRKKR